MKLRFLKQVTKKKVIEPNYDVPKWIRPLFGQKEVTLVNYKNTLQVLDNGKWIDVPTVLIEDEQND